MNGDKVAEETLYDKYRKIVKDFIKHKYSEYFDIDDDVSEILIKVFINLCNYDSSKSKFNTWVHNIAINYIIDKWRSNTCENITYVTNSCNNDDYILTSSTGNTVWCDDNFNICNTDVFTGNSSYTTSDTVFENQDTVSYITTQISNADYNLLNMKYIQGYNYKEIGQQFNLTSSTVSNKVNYIKTKLKKNLISEA